MGFSNDTPVQAIHIGDRSSRATDPAIKFHALTMDTNGNYHPSLAAEYALYLEAHPSAIDSQPADQEPRLKAHPKTHLTFRFRAAHPFDASPDTHCGIFTANLWQHDCSEFFLCNRTTGRYVEFNLNPHGAWWSASFNAPREHRCDEPFKDVHCSAASITDNPTNSRVATWSAAISIPLMALEAALETTINNLTANVTAILSTPNQIFLTAAPLGGEEPDFHQPIDWLPLRIAGRPS